MTILNFNYPNTPIIFSHQKGDEFGEQSYIVVDIDSVEKIGSSNVSSLTDTEFNITLIGSYEIDIQLNFLGRHSGEYSHDMLQNMADNPIVRENLQALGLNIKDNSSIRRIPQIRENDEWVEYHNMNVTFSYSAISKQTVGVVEQIDIVSTVKIGDSSTESSFSVP